MYTFIKREKEYLSLMVEIIGNKVTLELVKPVHLSLITGWSIKCRDSFFLINSILPISGDDLQLELATPGRSLYLVKDIHDQPIGMVKTFPVSTSTHNAGLAFTMQPSNNNTKLMGEAAELAADRLFKKQNIQKIYTHSLPREAEYKTVLLKMKYKKEGVLREHLFINNTYHDLEIFSLSAEDFANEK